MAIVNSTRFSTKRVIATIILASLSGLPSHVSAQESKPATLPDGLVLKTPTIPAEVTGTLRSLNESLSHNLSPSDNAAVYLVQLFGENVFEPKLRANSLDMLGIEHLSKTAPQFVYVEPFVRSQGVTTREGAARNDAALPDQIVIGSEKPWNRTQYPSLFAYLTFNRGALDDVVALSEKPRYYCPVLTDQDPPQILTASLAVERRLPFLVQVLTARAMLRFAEHKVVPALDDLLACQRLGLLLAVGSPLDVSAPKAQLINEIVCHASIAILQSGQLSGEQATTYLKRLERIPYLPPPNVAANQGERAILHQEIELLKREDTSLREFFDLPDTEGLKHLEQIRLSEIRWDQAIQRADEIQDQIVQALAIHDRKEQYQRFQKLDLENADWKMNSDEKTLEIAESVNKDLEPISRWIGETMAMSLRPWYWQRRLSDDRSHVRHDLVTVGMALVAFGGDHGEYPSKLAELAPKYLETIPLDAHSDAPFNYVRLEKNRARLFTWGINCQDDAGRIQNDDRTIELR